MNEEFSMLLSYLFTVTMAQNAKGVWEISCFGNGDSCVAAETKRAGNIRELEFFSVNIKFLITDIVSNHVVTQ